MTNKVMLMRIMLLYFVSHLLSFFTPFTFFFKHFTYCFTKNYLIRRNKKVLIFNSFPDRFFFFSIFDHFFMAPSFMDI